MMFKNTAAAASAATQTHAAAHDRRLQTAASGLAIAALLLLIAARWLARDTQVDWDEELYYQIGRAWAHGATPYLDVFDHKPPAVYLFYMLASLFGSTMQGVRIAVAVLLIGATIWLFRALAAKSLIERRLAPVFIAAVILLLSRGRGLGSNTELIYAPFLMGAFAGLLSGRPIVAALCATCALALKYTTALDLAGVAIAFVLTAEDKDAAAKNLVAWVIATIAATLAIYAAFYAYFASKGVDLFYEIVTRNIAHAVGERDAFLTLNPVTKALAFTVALAAAPFLLWGVRDKGLFFGAALWALMSLAQASLTGTYYPHYVLPVFAPIGIMLGCIRLKPWAAGLGSMAILLGAVLSLVGSRQALRDFETQARQIGEHCGQVDDKGYIMTPFIAGYRICGAWSVDRFMFPPFYVEEHFVAVAQSGGLQALAARVRSGEIKNVLVSHERESLNEIQQIIPASAVVAVDGAPVAGDLRNGS